MRTIIIALSLLLTGSALAQNPNPITPAETANNVGKRVTVEFVAKSNGFNGEGEGFSELGSEKDFENTAWFALRFSRKAMAELAKKGITSLGSYVEEKVAATGVVKEIDFGAKYGKRRFIYIDDLSQFEATRTKDELPKEVVAAWKEAGAEAGWMGPYWEQGLKFSQDRSGLWPARTVPAFRVGVWPEGGLAKLPSPGQAFGLELKALQVTDTRLKELAGLKQLTSLILAQTKVTDAGLKELASMKQLTSLRLSGFFFGPVPTVTDAGLKELAGLKQLTSLELVGSLSGVTEAGLKELAGMEQLTSLHLNAGSPLLPKNRPFTDADLKELAGMKQLTWLQLPFAQVTDVGLKELAGMKQLTSLQFSNNVKLTDAGLKELAGLKQLTSLDLNFTKVTDAGLKELAGLKQLTTLHLSYTGVTDAGMKELAGLEQLTTLYLWNTKVTGAGLKELAGLKKLSHLDLHGKQVTAEGLKGLAELKQLTTLSLSRPQVTREQETELRNALPKCQIRFLTK